MTRHIDFEGIDNFRDFGGYATACGRGVKTGRLFRSANHHRATDADLQRLRELGVKVILDLRNPQERVREPSRRWDRFEGTVLENNILSEHGDWVAALPAADLTPRWFYEDGLVQYARLPFEPRHVDLFSRYFRTLAAGDGAVVVHCAAGKDRTGLICALTHHIAGVHPDDTLQDYLLTNDESRMARKLDLIGPWFQQVIGRTPSDEALRVAVSVHPAYLDRAMTVIQEAHGSVDAYLEDVLGVDQALRQRIHERVLG
ncbi:protein-tyrosine-phosphatase [Phenylobacterium hankyongense]|uniref:Protein-tyrosine-phosphatase n=1 Tax=Phenylobacterium hankyongense TaxID=1813876 RepID=A0A328B4D5_9CAUL|nr:tyrosine-protein phosphatase [Phenylobacterium hankyongense]RAK59888.1 protein-tyrosine-phosphatase [Phenylobacterium hankyongense]